MPRHDKPRWGSVLEGEGEGTGTIHQKWLGRSLNFFDEVAGYFPVTGEPVGLKLSTSFAERCNVLNAFHEDPYASVRLPRSLHRHRQ